MILAMARLPPFTIYLPAEQKSLFMRAADHTHKSLSQHVRDLLARDVELRAEQGEPNFAGLRDELRKSQAKASTATHRVKAVNPADNNVSVIEQLDSEHGFTDLERQELYKRGLGSESSGEAIRAALREIRGTCW